MKCLKYVLLALVALISLSLITVGTSRLSEGINPGNPLPDIKNLESISGRIINLSDLKGQKVLVNFWAAYDANSRKENIFLSQLTKKSDLSLKVVSISIDKSKSVFAKTIAMDEVDETSQFYIDESSRRELVELYRLEEGFKNYLIDEDGVILTKNLNSQELDLHMTKN